MSDVVERAKAALEAVEAIGGPIWEVAGDDPRNPGCKVIADYDPEGAGLIGGVGHVVAPFIAQARSLVPELVAEVERLRGEVALNTRRWYIAGYRNQLGTVSTMGAENAWLPAVEEVVAELNRDDPENEFFVAYQDVPAWQRLEASQ